MGSNAPTGTRNERTHWVRSTIALPPYGEEPSAPKKRAGKRFVEPYRLNDEQRAMLLASLEERNIGDDEGRNLFASAMEYDLAGCKALAGTRPRPTVTPPAVPDEHDPAVTAVAEAARTLADGLAALPPQAATTLLAKLKEADRFKRDYSGEYLEALRSELARIAAAPEPSAAVHEPPEPAPLPDEVERFIRRAADAFRECFEQAPTVEPDAPFPVALAAVAGATDIPIPTDIQTLAGVLRSAP